MENRRYEDKVFIFSLLSAAVFMTVTVCLLLSGNATEVLERINRWLGTKFMGNLLFCVVTAWYGFMILFIAGMARVMYGAGNRGQTAYFVLNGIVFGMQIVAAVLFAICYLKELLFWSLVVSVTLSVCTTLGFVNANAAMGVWRDEYDIQD